MENTVRSYFRNRGMIKVGRVQGYDPNYVWRKMVFKAPCDRIWKRSVYSNDNVFSYLRNDKAKEPFSPPRGESEVLCSACNQRNVCMYKYLLDE